MLNEEFVNGEAIHVYSRADAIRDGVLVDVSDRAREAGFGVSVAMTASVAADIAGIPSWATGQDREGRLWDVLWMARLAVRRGEGSEAYFQVYLPVSEDTDTCDDEGDENRYCSA